MMNYRNEVWVILYWLSITCNQVHSQPSFDFESVVQPFHQFFDNCVPVLTCDKNAIYRTLNGSCNNLKHPHWGSTMTPYIRLGPATFCDNDHKVRVQSNGEKLPGPRELQLKMFLPRSCDNDDHCRNFHVNQFGQWTAHDITLMPTDYSGPRDCCAIQNTNYIPPQCELVINLSADDPKYSSIQKTCMEFRRAMTTTLNFNCSITPQIPLNHASAFIDSSQLYGHNDAKASFIRTNEGGKLKTEEIDGQEFPFQERRFGSQSCDGRENVKVCFDGGDPRRNQHFGVMIYQIVFTRFHNFLTDKLKDMNESWTDEDLYQKARRIVNAVNQIATYRDYLPILLGKEYTDSICLTLQRNTKTKYRSSIMPQLAVEFAAAAFRVPHNQVPPVYYFLDESENIKNQMNLNEYMSFADPVVECSNLEQILRGMSMMPGRLPVSSYNSLISSFMAHSWVPLSADIDLLSFDIQRGRDTGVMTYVQARELCGLSKVSSFDDLRCLLKDDDITEQLKQMYADVSDIDLIVGSLLEPLAENAMVGETTRCIIADGFYRLRYGDKSFCDVEGQPESFTKDQFDVLWNINLTSIFCAMTSMDKLPCKFFMSKGNSEMETCKRPMDINLEAWKCDGS